MPKHLISITEAAEQDLAEIVDYIANDNPAAALKLAENIAVPAAAAVSGKPMSGVGVASGRVTGTARLIRHPDEGGRLSPGEVLVAPSTDPGWTPLFLKAAALVMEAGGSLSHGAIVAREYGIPAVINVPGVMKVIKDGQTITVDGEEGKIFL